MLRRAKKHDKSRVCTAEWRTADGGGVKNSFVIFSQHTRARDTTRLFLPKKRDTVHDWNNRTFEYYSFTQLASPHTHITTDQYYL
jgi:hypothetical protein